MAGDYRPKIDPALADTIKGMALGGRVQAGVMVNRLLREALRARLRKEALEDENLDIQEERRLLAAEVGPILRKGAGECDVDPFPRATYLDEAHELHRAEWGTKR